MLELFSPFHLWRADVYDPSQLGLYAHYAVWFIGGSVLVETLVKSGEQFIANVKGRALFWFQLRTFFGLGLTYALCCLTMYLVLTTGFGQRVDMLAFAGAVGLAVLPRVYVVYGLIPYIGRTLQRLLDIWSLVLLFLALRQGVNIESGQVWILWGTGLGCYLVVQGVFNYRAGLPRVATGNTAALV